MSSRVILSVVLALVLPLVSLVPLDFSDFSELAGLQLDSDPVGNSTQIVAVNSTNGTDQDLYVIKTIVYEVALLTDAVDDDDFNGNGSYTQEQVDLTFFNAHGNGSYVDLGQIPIPVQANISGHVVTGITPVHAGTIPEDADLLASLLPEGASVSISKQNSTIQNDTLMASESLVEKLQELRNATDAIL